MVILLHTFMVVLLTIRISRCVIPEYCYFPLNTSDCGGPVQWVFHYHKPGSRCEKQLWMGCPTMNRFDDEYDCSHTCIGRHFSYENREPWNWIYKLSHISKEFAQNIDDTLNNILDICEYGNCDRPSRHDSDSAETIRQKLKLFKPFTPNGDNKNSADWEYSGESPANGGSSGDTTAHGGDSGEITAHGVNSGETTAHGGNSGLTTAHGNNSGGSPANGGNSNGTPAHGGNSGETPAHGNNSGGSPAHGGNSNGTPAHGGNSGETPAHGNNSGGSPAHGGNSNGTPAHGGNSGETPAHGNNSGGSPAHGGNSDGPTAHGGNSSISKTTSHNNADGKSNDEKTGNTSPKTEQQKEPYLITTTLAFVPDGRTGPEDVQVDIDYIVVPVGE